MSASFHFRKSWGAEPTDGGARFRIWAPSQPSMSLRVAHIGADLAMRDLLSRMTQRMQGCDSLLDLKEVVQRFVPEIAPSLAGSLYLIDPAHNAVVVACSWLEPSHSRPEFSPLACWALRRGLPHRPSGDQIGPTSWSSLSVSCATARVARSIT